MTIWSDGHREELLDSMIYVISTYGGDYADGGFKSKTWEIQSCDGIVFA